MRRRLPAPEVVAWLQDVSSAELHLSVLTLGEIRRGIELLRSRDVEQARAIETWLATIEAAFVDRVLRLDAPIADAWGRLRAVHTLPIVGSLIAATALVHGLTVVTRDRGPFERCGVPWLDPWAVADG